ncbi:hypothetical protein A9Q89_06385 [Gammaproteobacteria bacterium 53_120_T64]|nr:hypothetical protein A9Q89_06385 [Gammaproteobacteria bacterium 53_120_T64]
MSKILLLGCGGLGGQLAARLIAAKHRVIGVKRSPLKEALTGLQLVMVDITRASEVAEIPTAVDLVIVLLSPGERNKAAYQELYQDGIANVLAHFSKASGQGPRPRWLMVSSTSVYAQNAGEWVDEASPTLAQSFNGEALIGAEQQLWAHSGASTVVRFSGIYGPGRESLVRRVREGRPLQYGPAYYSNRIHEQDCLGILCFLIDRALAGLPLETLYLASDSAPVPLAEVAGWLSEQLACSPPPATLSHTSSGAMNKRCRNSRLLNLGYVLRYRTYREGYGDLFERGLVSGDALPGA